MGGVKRLSDFDTGKLAGAHTDRGYNQSTASGRPFWSTDPRPEDIRIYDIAAQLARICRFNGALRDDIDHFSVAQHCCNVSDHCAPHLRLEGLLHDAQETYIGDLIKPVKLQVTGWKMLEGRIERAIRARFGLPLALTPAVKEQDWHAFPTEVRDICPPMLGVDHGNMPEPWPERIEPWSATRARAEFMARFEELYRGA